MASQGQGALRRAVADLKEALHVILGTGVCQARLVDELLAGSGPGSQCLRGRRTAPPAPRGGRRRRRAARSHLALVR